MSAETKNAIGDKHTIRKKHGSKSKEYKAAKAKSKKLVKKDQLNKIEKDFDTISSLPPEKQYYATIKRLYTTIVAVEIPEQRLRDKTRVCSLIKF